MEYLSLKYHAHRHGQLDLNNPEFLNSLLIMLLDKNKYTESEYVGETLIGDAVQQLQQRYMAVRQGVKDHDFSYEEALEAYQVSDADYKAFLKEDTENGDLDHQIPQIGNQIFRNNLTILIYWL